MIQFMGGVVCVGNWAHVLSWYIIDATKLFTSHMTGLLLYLLCSRLDSVK